MCMCQNPERPHKGIGYLGTGVITIGYEPPMWVLGQHLNLRPGNLDLLSIEPSISSVPINASFTATE